MDRVKNYSQRNIYTQQDIEYCGEIVDITPQKHKKQLLTLSIC